MFQSCRAIARTTIRELIRSKVLYLTLAFALALVCLAALFGSVTIGNQLTIIKDFGLMSLSFFSVAFILFSGTMLLAKELSRKTILNVLAKPIHRSDFLIGKYIGMLSTTYLMILIMGACLSITCYFFESHWDPNLGIAYLYIALDAALICGITMLLSAILVTPLLAGLISFGIFLAGRSAEYIRMFFESIGTAGGQHPIAQLCNLILPRFDRLNLANELVYGASISGTHLMWAALYVFAYTTGTIVLAALVFSRRDFN